MVRGGEWGVEGGGGEVVGVETEMERRVEDGRVERKLHNTLSANDSGFCDVVQVMLSPWRMG